MWKRRIVDDRRWGKSKSVQLVTRSCKSLTRVSKEQGRYNCSGSYRDAVLC